MFKNHDKQRDKSSNFVYCKKLIPQCSEPDSEKECTEPTSSFQIFIQTKEDKNSQFSRSPTSKCSPKITVDLLDSSNSINFESNEKLARNEAKKWMKSEVFETCGKKIEKISIQASCDDDWHGGLILKRQDLNVKPVRTHFWRLLKGGEKFFWVDDEVGRFDLDLLKLRN